MINFDSYENLKVWMTSHDRKYWLTQVESLVESDPDVQEISGLFAAFFGSIIKKY